MNELCIRPGRVEDAPALRKLARELIRRKDADEFLSSLPHRATGGFFIREVAPGRAA